MALAAIVNVFPASALQWNSARLPMIKSYGINHYQTRRIL
jgi:hypothetical protein